MNVLVKVVHIDSLSPVFLYASNRPNLVILIMTIFIFNIPLNNLDIGLGRYIYVFTVSRFQFANGLSL